MSRASCAQECTRVLQSGRRQLPNPCAVGTGYRIPPAMVLPLETRTYLVPPEVFKIAQINVHQGNTIPLSNVQNVVRSEACHGHERKTNRAIRARKPQGRPGLCAPEQWKSRS